MIAIYVDTNRVVGPGMFRAGPGDPNPDDLGKILHIGQKILASDGDLKYEAEVVGPVMNRYWIVKQIGDFEDLDRIEFEQLLLACRRRDEIRG